MVWQVVERQIDWFVLTDGEYRPLPMPPSGMLESRVFPGLRMAVDALLQGDIARVLAELCNGLSNPEHAEFAQHLRAAGQLGRDFLSRLIHGARLSLFVGLAATTLHVVVAALVGGVAGFLGGRFDLVMQRFVDAWMSMPGLLVLR